MTSGLNTTDPTLVAAFQSALLTQLAVIVGICLALMLAYWFARNWRSGAAAPPPRSPAARTPAAEPKARRYLRISFGILWIIDGILQAQPQMAGGLPSEVVQPSAAASPGWVQDIVNAGGTIWSFHPVEAAAAAVWIQLGAGVWLIAADTGWWSRLGGLASAGWGLVVWVFGEAFGGIFAPGLTWLMGAPGAVVLYIVAGAAIALPVRSWAGPRAGRLLLGATGAFWIGMAVLQAWPGRGFWGGGEDGTLTSLVSDMAGLDQPRPQQIMMNATVWFATHGGFAANLIAVVALAAGGAALVAGVTRWRDRPAVLRIAVPASIAFCLVVWVLVQDLGIPGGLGTDPNSMLPWALLLWAGYKSATQEPLSAERPVPSPAPSSPRSGGGSLPLVPRPAMAGPAMAGPSLAVPAIGGPAIGGPAMAWPALRGAITQTVTLATARTVTTLGALAVVLVGAAPLAVAAADWHADPLIARAMAGPVTAVNRPAPDFRLVSQSGRPVSLASLRGKVTLLTFLDPACGAYYCPVATEMKEAGALLGTAGGQVQLVAIAANQFHYGLQQVRTLDAKEGLDTVPNWLYLTGSAPQLQHAWGAYGIFVSHMAPGASSVMRDMVFVIDKNGRIRQQILDSPMAATLSVRSSYANLLAQAARQALGS